MRKSLGEATEWASRRAEKVGESWAAKSGATEAKFGIVRASPRRPSAAVHSSPLPLGEGPGVRANARRRPSLFDQHLNLGQILLRVAFEDHAGALQINLARRHLDAMPLLFEVRVNFGVRAAQFFVRTAVH